MSAAGLLLPLLLVGRNLAATSPPLHRPYPPYRAWGFPSCSPAGYEGGTAAQSCPLLANLDSFGATNLFLTANGNGECDTFSTSLLAMLHIRCCCALVVE